MPGCVAWIVQLPPPMIVTVLPEIAHTPVVVEANVTASPSGAPPDIAVALTLNGATPNVTSGN